MSRTERRTSLLRRGPARRWPAIAVAASAAIRDALAVEPYAVNYDESGNFLGAINFAPHYAQCP